MPFAPNPERRRIICEYWKQGKTNREIEKLTGIKEGTVSYYTRQFNKKEGRRIVNHNQDPVGYKTPKTVDEDFYAVKLEKVRDVYESLIEERKYMEAKAYLEGVLLFDQITLRYLSHLSHMIYGPLFLKSKRKPGEPIGYLVVRIMEESAELRVVEDAAEKLSRSWVSYCKTKTQSNHRL